LTELSLRRGEILTFPNLNLSSFKVSPKVSHIIIVAKLTPIYSVGSLGKMDDAVWLQSGKGFAGGDHGSLISNHVDSKVSILSRLEALRPPTRKAPQTLGWISTGFTNHPKGHPSIFARQVIDRGLRQMPDDLS
jgi:hypothetical protein